MSTNDSTNDNIICTLQYEMEQLKQEIVRVDMENHSLHARIDELEGIDASLEESEMGYGGTF